MGPSPQRTAPGPSRARLHMASASGGRVGVSPSSGRLPTYSRDQGDDAGAVSLVCGGGPSDNGKVCTSRQRSPPSQAAASSVRLPK